MHAEELVTLEKSPGAHGIETPRLQYLPIAHPAQGCVMDMTYFPGPHDAQGDVAPDPVEYVRFEHVVHAALDVAPEELRKVPGTHRVQTVEDVDVE